MGKNRLISIFLNSYDISEKYLATGETGSTVLSSLSAHKQIHTNTQTKKYFQTIKTYKYMRVYQQYT